VVTNFLFTAKWDLWELPMRAESLRVCAFNQIYNQSKHINRSINSACQLCMAGKT